MMFDRLPEVVTDYEFKWAPTYPAQPQHRVIPDRSFSCRTALENLSEDARVVGSKLVFDPVLMTGEEYVELAQTVESEIAIIHLVRSYAEIASSVHRGFFHMLSRPEEPATGVMYRALRISTRAFKQHQMRPSTEKRRKAPLIQVVKLFRNLLRHDLWAAKLSWRNPYMRIRYRRIAPEFPRMARFVGSTASSAAAAKIVASPPTVKLPAENVIINEMQVRLLAWTFHLVREVAFLGIRIGGWFVETRIGAGKYPSSWYT
jgi:hypothetical protein